MPGLLTRRHGGPPRAAVTARVRLQAAGLGPRAGPGLGLPIHLQSEANKRFGKVRLGPQESPRCSEASKRLADDEEELRGSGGGGELQERLPAAHCPTCEHGKSQWSVARPKSARRGRRKPRPVPQGPRVPVTVTGRVRTGPFEAPPRTISPKQSNRNQ